MDTGLRVEVLGRPRVTWRGTELQIPTQKVLAIVGYLAVEGRPASRRELMELLWGPGQVRNLRQAIHRLRSLPGASEWLEATEYVSLRTEWTDLAAFERAVLEGRYEDALSSLSGSPLLADLDPRSAPAFLEWLASKRPRIDALYGEALRGRALDLEEQGEYAQALSLARRVLELDDLDESAYRLVMRIEFRRGNVQAALSHYETCRRRLRTELGVSPLEETSGLAQEIERRSVIDPLDSIEARPRMPPSLLHPPVLAGREREWNEMEEAWQKGHNIFLLGPAGVGKTRLMMDFARAKGDVLFNHGSPEDHLIPLSTYARACRTYLRSQPDATATLDTWVRREASRLLPELASADFPPPAPIESDDDRFRFYSALWEIYWIAAQSCSLFATDDVHLHDETSFAVAGQAAARLVTSEASASLAREIVCARGAELSDAKRRAFETHVGSGLATPIDVEPLDALGVRQMLDGLGVGREVSELELHALSGGNPQYVLETLKAYVETGTLTMPSRKREVVPAYLSRTVSRRLTPLSDDAQRVLQCTALLEGRAEPETVAAIIDRDPFATADLLGDLERRLLLRDGDFPHELLREAVTFLTPGPVRRLLHARAGRHFEEVGERPSRIAHHWREAGEMEKSLPWLVEAAEEALAMGAPSQAVEWLERVLEEASPVGRLEARARFLMGRALRHLDKVRAREAIEAAMSVSRELGWQELEGSCILAMQELDAVPDPS